MGNDRKRGKHEKRSSQKAAIKEEKGVMGRGERKTSQG